MVTLKDSIYLQLNWQSALPMSWGDILLSLSTRGPKHSSLEGGQPPPNHSTRAEPCQNHARLMIQPRRAQASSQEYCPAHTLLLCPRNGRSTVALLAHLCTPVPLASGLALRPEAVPGSQPSSWWGQSDTLSKPRSLPSLPLSCTQMRHECI